MVEHLLTGGGQVDLLAELLEKRQSRVLLELLDLPVHRLQLLLRDHLALERLGREIVPVRGDGLLRLRLERDDVLLELLLL